MIRRLVLPRPKRTAVLALLLICLGLFCFFLTNPTYASPGEPFELSQKRSTFKNAIYASWTNSPSENTGLDPNCDRYLKKLSSYLPRRRLPSFEKVVTTKFPQLLYEKKKWIAEEKKHYRRRLQSKGIRFEESHINDLSNFYYQQLQQLSAFEEGFVEDLNHLRVFGKCLMDSQCSFLGKDASFNEIVRQLFPWFLGLMPSVDRKLAPAPPKNIIAQARETLKGRGIVIPLLPEKEKFLQLVNTEKLIRILRTMGSELPIEIIYVDEEFINEKSATSILAAAKDEINIALESRNEYLNANQLISSMLKMPSQEVRLVNVKPTINPALPINDNLMFALSSIFNSFEEAIVISPQTIPLMKDLQVLFENDGYKEHGTLFFKRKALLEFKPQKPPRGERDMNDLINNYARVNDFDKLFFGINAPDIQDTNVIRKKGYTKFLDPSLMVINKSKVLPGLLISSALPFYGVLSGAYDFSGQFNPELMWLGQEISGAVEKVHFNKRNAVAAGVLTPPENLPEDSPSQELCSSSWAQLYDDGYTLVYITSHQLDNLHLRPFLREVRTKFSVTKDGKDQAVVHPMIEQNILAIQSVLVPHAIENPKFDLMGQLSMSWRRVDSFGLADDYWCAYDVVEGAHPQGRGTTIDYGSSLTSWYMFLVDTWVQSG